MAVPPSRQLRHDSTKCLLVIEMKSVHSKDGIYVLMSIDEAKTLYSCAIESNATLEDWEYDIRIGVGREEVLALQMRLKELIIETGQWGKA